MSYYKGIATIRSISYMLGEKVFESFMSSITGLLKNSGLTRMSASQFALPMNGMMTPVSSTDHTVTKTGNSTSTAIGSAVSLVSTSCRYTKVSVSFTGHSGDAQMIFQVLVTWDFKFWNFFVTFTLSGENPSLLRPPWKTGSICQR